ncbi:hypothetical protein EDB19DRAFT_826338 [Suillus lakei]|nr:hypothetical protein EDB19DRAFT_826338 [Suillus lakei]
MNGGLPKISGECLLWFVCPTINCTSCGKAEMVACLKDSCRKAPSTGVDRASATFRTTARTVSGQLKQWATSDDFLPLFGTIMSWTLGCHSAPDTAIATFTYSCRRYADILTFYIRGKFIIQVIDIHLSQNTVLTCVSNNNTGGTRSKKHPYSADQRENTGVHHDGGCESRTHDSWAWGLGSLEKLGSVAIEDFF